MSKIKHSGTFIHDIMYIFNQNDQIILLCIYLHNNRVFIEVYMIFMNSFYPLVKY